MSKDAIDYMASEFHGRNMNEAIPHRMAPMGGSSEKPSDISAWSILTDAADQIQERAELRDSADGERSMGKAVAMFNACEDEELTETQGWRFQMCLKMARSSGGSFHEDDYIDLAGYAGLAGECAGNE